MLPVPQSATPSPSDTSAHAAPFDAGTHIDNMGLSDLIAAPWALAMPVHAGLMTAYAEHRSGPKFDVKAMERSLGVSLATQRPGVQIVDSVAIVSIHGLIVPKPNLLTRAFGATSARWALEDLNAAMSNPAVKSIILSIDSPGGSVYGTPELAAAVFEASRNKPVVAHSAAQMLSAAYWIGAAANAVYISSEVVNAGGIGILMTKTFDAPEAASKYTELFAGRYKQYTSSGKPPTEDAVSYLQTMVDYLYSIFVGGVATYRGVPANVAAERMAEGRTFIGQQAIDIGLADEIMPLKQLVDAMSRNPSAFANRRRIGARRVATPQGAGAAALQGAPAAPATIPQRVLNKAEQAAVAVAYAKEKDIEIVQALKVLGFAT